MSHAGCTGEDTDANDRRFGEAGARRRPVLLALPVNGHLARGMYAPATVVSIHRGEIVFTSLTARQKAATYYLIAIALALLVAVFGPAQSDGIQLLSMFTPAVAVLLMLMVVTRDGHHRAGWAELGLHRAAFASGRWRSSPQPRSSRCPTAWSGCSASSRGRSAVTS